MDQDLIMSVETDQDPIKSDQDLTIETDRDLTTEMDRDLTTEMDQDLTIETGQDLIIEMDRDLILETFEVDLILKETSVREIGWKVLDLQPLPEENLLLIAIEERTLEVGLPFGVRDQDHKALPIQRICHHGTTMIVLGTMEKMHLVDVHRLGEWIRVMTRGILSVMILLGVRETIIGDLLLGMILGAPGTTFEDFLVMILGV
jgi:hypothetical protein